MFDEFTAYFARKTRLWRTVQAFGKVRLFSIASSPHRSLGGDSEAVSGELLFAIPSISMVIETPAPGRIQSGPSQLLIVQEQSLSMTHLSMPHCITSLDDMRAFVQETICEQKQLLLGAFQFHEKILVRHGRPCSMHFFLSGPRAVQFSAIWDVARKTLFFYDCNGERFHVVHLLDDTAEAKSELGRLAEKREKIAA